MKYVLFMRIYPLDYYQKTFNKASNKSSYYYEKTTYFGKKMIEAALSVTWISPMQNSSSFGFSRPLSNIFYKPILTNDLKIFKNLRATVCYYWKTDVHRPQRPFPTRWSAKAIKQSLIRRHQWKYLNDTSSTPFLLFNKEAAKYILILTYQFLK